MKEVIWAKLMSTSFLSWTIPDLLPLRHASRRSELSCNCPKMSGIFSPPVQVIFIKWINNRTWQLVKSSSKIFYSIFRVKNRTTRKLCLTHSPSGICLPFSPCDRNLNPVNHASRWTAESHLKSFRYELQHLYFHIAWHIHLHLQALKQK